MTDFKKLWKKIWHFLWEEDSILSWMVNILLAFVIIKFLLYPGLGLVLGSPLPVVAVISESMEHQGDFDSWWNSAASCGKEYTFDGSYTPCTQKDWYAQYNITREQFMAYPFHNGFQKGDIIILRGISYDQLAVGQVIVFNSHLSYPVIHRVINKGDMIQTKGDNNPRQIVDAKLNEKYVTSDQLIARAWFRIPYVGYVKIWFVNAFNWVLQ